jgi:uncharacterized membrane protein
MVKIILLVLLSEIFTAAGQIFLKKGANNLRSYTLRGVNGHILFLKEALSKPLIWAGLASLSVSLVIWLIALAEGDLSLVYPIGSLQYILILFSAHIFLGEKIDMGKLIGTFLVVFGIILIAVG